MLALSDSTGASDLSMNPRNPRELYAGMWRGERKPWALISGGAEGGVYKSTDGGDSWEKLEGGLPAGVVGKVGVAVSPADPERVWAIIQHEPDGGVWRSDDAGKTWTRVNGDNSLRQRAFYYTQVVADPSDKNTVWGLNVRLHRSIDGGVKFEEVAVPHGDIHDLWINPGDSRIMIVGDDGGGQVTLNGCRVVVHLPEPAHRRVLRRDRGQRLPLSPLRRTAGQHDDQRARLADEKRAERTRGLGEHRRLRDRPDRPPSRPPGDRLRRVLQRDHRPVGPHDAAATLDPELHAGAVRGGGLQP